MVTLVKSFIDKWRFFFGFESKKFVLEELVFTKSFSKISFFNIVKSDILDFAKFIIIERFSMLSIISLLLLALYTS